MESKTCPCGGTVYTTGLNPVLLRDRGSTPLTGTMSKEFITWGQSEALMNMPVDLVVHCKKEPYDVYIGRPSKWGNPFSDRPGTSALFICESRAEAIIEYEYWLQDQPELLAALPELRGKILGCWCKPKACHGDVLVRLANLPV